jgi:hypothetical protein
MNVSKDVNFEELGQSTEDFNGAQLKAVCVEVITTNPLSLSLSCVSSFGADECW